MALTKQQVRKVLDIYIRAWVTQDPGFHLHDLHRPGHLPLVVPKVGARVPSIPSAHFVRACRALDVP
jgi:hypothetical protein